MTLTLTPTFLLTSAGLLGMCIGSFLNVCIYRLPASKSVLFPGSMCSGCGKPIRFYDNIPIISYFLLRGKCRDCGVPFSFRYPAVEILTGLMAVSVAVKFGFSWEALVYFLFICALLVITFIDIDHQIIPNGITLPGIPVCVAATLLLPQMTIAESIIGILIGGGSLLIVAWLYVLFTGKEGMGGGDIKLLAMIGALIGWEGILFTIFISSAVGSVIGITLMLRMKKDMKFAVPFGPFLSIGAICYVFFGNELIFWYLNKM